MELIGNKIVLGTTKCTCAMGGSFPPGKVAGSKVCTECKGTMRGKRGGRNGCRACFNGRMHDFVNLVTCGRCDGTTIVPETITDQLPHDIYVAIPIEVIRDAHRRHGFNEQYLGLGFTTSVTDYGRTWEQNDDAKLIAEIHKSTWNQASAYTHKNENGEYILCSKVVVIVNKMGYTGKAVFGNEDPKDNSQIDATVKAMFDPVGLASAEAMIG